MPRNNIRFTTVFSMPFFKAVRLVSYAWKAIAANQAMYALKSSEFGIARQSFQALLDDEKLPRDQLSHIYKFGWCTPDSFKRQFLRKSLNVTFPTWESTQLNYIYVLAKKRTINFRLQCVVMRAFVPQKYLFFKSRLPLYYCQGTVFIIMLNTINRYQIHEFYIHTRLNMPINFSFEFYHPTQL